jgi:crotonobetainyl-CoA:carnitine CoA-transferase CaiB-like acyl-CoA transferase
LLSPYRVLDLTSGGAAICGQALGDLGADVILLEPPGGNDARRAGPFLGGQSHPDRSLSFWAVNRNKRSVTVDITKPDGRDVFHRLVAGADFVLESFAPGYLPSLGLGYEALAAVNPRTILVSMTPFGQAGPKAGWAASDLTIMAASGAMSLTGDDDRAPVRLSLPQAMLHAGAEAGCGALIAHFARLNDGLGQHVDVSAQEAAMMATQSMVLNAGWGEDLITRTSGGLKLGPINLRFVQPCKDGYVSVTFLFGTAIGPFTRRLLEVMHAEGFVDDATRDKDWLGYTTMLVTGQEPLSELDRCIGCIREWTLSHTKDELFEIALARGLLIVPVNTTADVVHSKQLAERDFWRDLLHTELDRPVRYPGPFAKFSKTPIQYRRRPPLMGEHTAEVLGEAGYSPGQLRDLSAEGVI